METKEKIVKILEAIKPGVDFEQETKIVGGQVLTSMNIVRLVMDLSEEFDITISPVAIIPENFETVDAMVRLVERCEEE